MFRYNPRRRPTAFSGCAFKLCKRSPVEVLKLCECQASFALLRRCVAGLCDYVFLVPVAYATGKYVSPSKQRKQAVILGFGFTQLAGDRLH